MKYIKVINGIHPNNTYLLYDDDNNCLIIDPSLYSDIIDKEIIEHNFNVCGILLTHAHYDHIFSVDFFVDKYKCDVYCSANASKYLGDASLNLSKTSVNSPCSIEIKSKAVIVEDTLKIKGFEFTVMDTRGHSNTCVTYLIDNLAFTGDFVFKNTIGRCDLFDSSKELMDQSIYKFMNLNKNYIILPGHGDVTTLEEEKVHNSHFIRVRKIYE